MVDSILFNGFNTLDFQDIRMNVIRIPEVNSRLLEAQQIWDHLGKKEFCFNNFMAAEDVHYLRSIQLKSLVAAIVQVGLYDRYIKNFRNPQFIIGNSNGNSPLHVAAGKKSFFEMVEQSEAAQVERSLGHLQIAQEPVLSGISLSEYEVYQLKKDEKSNRWAYQSLEVKDMNIDKLITKLIDDYGARKFINVGPGNLLLDKMQDQFALTEIQVLESIDIDPLLSWFWTQVQPSKLKEVAQ